MTLNWIHIKTNDGWYRLKDSFEIFFRSLDGVVSILIPENQHFAIVDSSVWSDSQFEKHEETQQ
jgi:hypothetical protein